jgi:antitoxin HicB
MLFKIRGISYEITAEAIVSAARDVSPDVPNGMNKYCVALEGGRYPIKQLISLVIGLPRVGFTAQDAHRILTKLDFEIQEYAATKVSESRAKYGGADALSFPITIEQDEDDIWVASCPSLHGCHSQGVTQPEAIANIREAIRGYLASMQSHGETLPDQKWALVEVSL